MVSSNFSTASFSRCRSWGRFGGKALSFLLQKLLSEKLDNKMFYNTFIHTNRLLLILSGKTKWFSTTRVCSRSTLNIGLLVSQWINGLGQNMYNKIADLFLKYLFWNTMLQCLENTNKILVNCTILKSFSLLINYVRKYGKDSCTGI